MDGNGRWARQRGLPRQAGHRAGVRTARMVVEACAKRGVGTLTLFAFSSENWRRPRREVGALMRLFIEALEREVDELHANGIRLQFHRRSRQPFAVRCRRAWPRRRNRTRGNDRLSWSWRWPTAAAGTSSAPPGRWRAKPPRAARSRGDRRCGIRAAARPGRPAGPGPADPHRRRASRISNFPAVEPRLRRVLLHRPAVAGLRRTGPRCRPRPFPQGRAPLRHDLGAGRANRPDGQGHARAEGADRHRRAARRGAAHGAVFRARATSAWCCSPCCCWSAPGSGPGWRMSGGPVFYRASFTLGGRAVDRLARLVGADRAHAGGPAVGAAAIWAMAAALLLARFPVRIPPVAVLMAGLVILPLAWLAFRHLLKTRAFGASWALYLFLIVAAADVGAYFVGRRFGRVKLAPHGESRQDLGRTDRRPGPGGAGRRGGRLVRRVHGRPAGAGAGGRRNLRGRATSASAC
jgi:hypothetical protein